MEYFPLSVDQYLETEKESQVRHEFINGYIHAMVGCSRRHNIISVTISRLFGNHLAGTGCQVYASDMKVKAGSQSDNIYFYPDVMVSCSHQKRDQYTEHEPKLLVEVFSPSTEQFDRLSKLEAYTQIPSLEEYLLVDQQLLKVDLYRRAGQQWILTCYRESETVRLLSIDLDLSVAAVYQDVEGIH